MTLATHILIAGAIAKPISSAHPAILFGVSVLSHYLADLIPHWDYDIRSIDNKEKNNADIITWRFSDKQFLWDIFRFGLDAGIGFFILLLIVWPETLSSLLKVLAVSAGALFPDALQGIYFTRKAEFLRPIQRIHDFFHTKIRLGPYPLIGIPFQALFVFIALYLLF